MFLCLLNFLTVRGTESTREYVDLDQWWNQQLEERRRNISPEHQQRYSSTYHETVSSFQSQNDPSMAAFMTYTSSSTFYDQDIFTFSVVNLYVYLVLFLIFNGLFGTAIFIRSLFTLSFFSIVVTFLTFESTYMIMWFVKDIIFIMISNFLFEIGTFYAAYITLTLTVISSTCVFFYSFKLRRNNIYHWIVIISSAVVISIAKIWEIININVITCLIYFVVLGFLTLGLQLMTMAFVDFLFKERFGLHENKS